MNVIMLVSCQDQPGIIAAVTSVIHAHHCNINQLEQYNSDNDSGFFLRVNWSSNGEDKIFWKNKFAAVIRKYTMQVDFFNEAEKTNIAILVSKSSHCLYDILAHYQSGRLNAKVAFVASNHNDLKNITEQFGCVFYHCPILNKDKASQEAKLRSLMQQHNVKSIVLARYMQILSSDFIEAYNKKIINIHHSFLPAFVGAKPYHQAWDKGVKLIGATSHFVTSELDQGPIITQSVANINHKNSVNDLIEFGKTLEQQTLINALNLYLKHKIIVHKSKTIVFQ